MPAPAARVRGVGAGCLGGLGKGRARRLLALLAIGPEPLATFESYLPGPNAAALDHLMALPAGAAPVYLWGPSGSGKSHLLQALAGRCQAAGQTVGWFDPATPGPWSWHPDWSLVVLDGCEGLCVQQQQQAFALFVEATGAGVQWAAAGRLPPPTDDP